MANQIQVKKCCLYPRLSAELIVAVSAHSETLCYDAQHGTVEAKWYYFLSLPLNTDFHLICTILILKSNLTDKYQFLLTVLALTEPNSLFIS